MTAARRPAAGSTADALDFRVFRQQQAALDAHSKQPQAHSSSVSAAASAAQPPTEITVPPNAEDRSSDMDNSVRPDGVDSTSHLADATAAAAKGLDSHGDVFSRLYEAGQTSLRRKEAYAKASAAAERAALQSASLHPVPLPARLPAAGTSRPASPAGGSDPAFVCKQVQAHRCLMPMGARPALQFDAPASILLQAAMPGSASLVRRPAPSTLRPTCTWHRAPDR